MDTVAPPLVEHPAVARRRAHDGGPPGERQPIMRSRWVAIDMRDPRFTWDP